MTDYKSKRILIVCPGGLKNQGGIGRMIGNFTKVWAERPHAPQFKIIDTRGIRNLLWAQGIFLFALISLARDLLLGRVELVHIHLSSYGSTVRKYFVVLLSRMAEVPFLLHLHGSEYQKFFSNLPKPAQSLVINMFSQAARIIVLGYSWRDYIHTKMEIPLERIVVLHNAVPEPPDQKKHHEEGLCKILFLGRLGDRKGVPELLEALGMIEVKALSWEATLAGDGEVDRFQSMAANLSLQNRISFPGWVGPQTVTALLRGADVLVLPSHNEGLPMSVIEGMAHGLTIITTPVGSINEIVEDEVSGLIVPPGDSNLLAKALFRVITDQNLRERLSSGARKKFQDQLEIKKYVKRLEDVYNTCCKR